MGGPFALAGGGYLAGGITITAGGALKVVGGLFGVAVLVEYGDDIMCSATHL